MDFSGKVRSDLNPIPKYTFRISLVVAFEVLVYSS